ncbi:TraR/DksA family transcriptional regulator [Streptacidiphilus sp. P02-A3a]|uniref:TraR/DksA family transcriptional regulator n=1 Tax=Streptacidiphilus sp. P02-A3a TaxID=2704468 RepID=UPI0015F852C5|nr:TraR/DksA family transcriptional regulator [Streptacidiphilus sp. P02-A3a]QMU68575.1 TraR/DksA family transcriptional regulator [Streptacidiphilus sp. P02-A3a]
MADKARSGAARARWSGCHPVTAAEPGERAVVRRKTGAATAKPAAGHARMDPVAVAPVAAVPDTGPGALPVRPGEDPWTQDEVTELQEQLRGEAATLRAEIQTSEETVSGLMRDSGDGAGDDQVDAGTKNISREHELSLAANAREMLEQTERALLRLAGTGFGLCESCGQPIGKARVQAFPRATLCVQCKQKQERR